jgi:alanine racemase
MTGGILSVYRGTFAIVDLSAIQENVAAVRRQLSPSTRLMVAVKANGYGHGAAEAAQAAQSGGATDFAVASLEEGLRLRDAGIQEPILVLGHVSALAAKHAAARDIAVTVTDLEELSATSFHPPLRIHVKVDTGMNRLGVRTADEALNLVKSLAHRSDIIWEGMFTHLATADEPASEQAEEQIQRFNQVLNALKRHGYHCPLVHAANSAGVFRTAAWQYDMVRIGIVAYGYPPKRTFPLPAMLQPALNLYSFISRVVTIQPGESVGYGATFTAVRETRIATVPVGYADGYPRILSNRSAVVVRGQSALISGNICMDQMMIDVTDIAGVGEGDCVTLYGRYAPPDWNAFTFNALTHSDQKSWLKQTFREAATNPVLSLDDLAKTAQTISYELMCALSERVPRVYVRNK